MPSMIEANGCHSTVESGNMLTSSVARFGVSRLGVGSAQRGAEWGGNWPDRVIQGAAIHGRCDPLGGPLVSPVPDQLLRS
jgi:hypothetical protein